MRNIKEVRQEIAKLQAEAAAIEAHDHKVNSAVHVLENLGWKHNGKVWVRPSAPKVKVDISLFDSKVHNPFKVGDFVMYTANEKYTGRVAEVRGDQIKVHKYIRRNGPRGLVFETFAWWYPAKSFKAITHMGLTA